MKTALLSVGTELLFGQITNTNTVFLSQQLQLLGFDVLYHYTVGDNAKRLAEVMETALQDCDLIITTGGLGPTEDDMTKEIACEVLHDTLVMHEPSLAALHEIARKRGRAMTENNLKQAMMPTRAVVFDNDAGSAPGMALSEGEKTIICMPGPPREMKRMWERRVKPYLEEKQNSVIYYKMLRFFGIGESSLETALLDLIDNQTDPTLATYAKEGECTVRVASKRESLEEASSAVDEMIAAVKMRVGEYLFSEDDENLAEVVGRKLIDRNISISSCESCTAGMFSAELAGVPGISAVFDRGIATYTWKAKMEELGVSLSTLEAYSAESREVCEEMVRGLFDKTGSRVCVSVTGVAGPGGTEEKPAGTIYIGCLFDDQLEIRELKTGRDNRNWNRHYAMLHMFDLINKMLG